MAENSPIEWTDHTWSPWEGCTRVSISETGGGGCDNCYAEAMNRWLRKGENWGPGAPRRIYSEEHWEKPIRWQRNAPKFHTLHGRRQRVFPSVCDPFDNEVSPVLRERLWGTIRLTPALDWLLLTKRIGNARSMLPADWGDGYPNVWIGATVVNQTEADRDIPKLLALPAPVRFLSIEPMLGPIYLQKACTARCPNGDCMPHSSGRRVVVDSENGGTLVECICSRLNGIHWVIAGGESGPGARPMHPDWARSLRDQCAAAGVPFMFKQWGEWGPTWTEAHAHMGFDAPHDPAGDKAIAGTRLVVATYRDGSVREELWPIVKVGKKAAGRLLDGIEHNGFPEGVCR